MILNKSLICFFYALRLSKVNTKALHCRCCFLKYLAAFYFLY